MPIIVTAGRIHCTAAQAEFESAEFTPNTAFKNSQTLSVKKTKMGTRGRIGPYLHEKTPTITSRS
jgi:hypothetical protein